jgi:hypothetical protein
MFRLSRIRIPDLDFVPIPDPGVKKTPDPGSGTLVGPHLLQNTGEKNKDQFLYDGSTQLVLENSPVYVPNVTRQNL